MAETRRARERARHGEGVNGYRLDMPGDNDGLTPDAVPAGGMDQHTRIQDKERFAGKPEAEGLPGEEDVDLEDGVEDPAEVTNRRDVPDTPENSVEARTDGDPAEITEP